MANYTYQWLTLALFPFCLCLCYAMKDYGMVRCCNEIPLKTLGIKMYKINLSKKKTVSFCSLKGFFFLNLRFVCLVVCIV